MDRFRSGVAAFYDVCYLPAAMDEQDKPQNVDIGPHFLNSAESHDELYQRYCEYAEAGRAASLRVILSPESRRSLSEDSPALCRREFYEGLTAMTDQERERFLARVKMGFAAARELYREEMLRRFRPAA